MTISQEQILKELKRVIDPVTKQNIVSIGIVSHILIDDKNNVRFSLEIEPHTLGDRKSLIMDCKGALSSLDSINNVTVAMTNKPLIAKNTIVVASGKGGVGKSTIALNIAVGIANAGYKVAIVDADIYGPSIPHMLGIEKKPDIQSGRIIPCEKYGIKSMSIGYFLPASDAVVWRGPMVTKSLQQMILGVDWGTLDYMIIDTPPGTGDIHISLAKMCKVSYAIIVSTPQELANIDALKACDMFKKLKIPIMGVIENMSYFIGSDQKRHNLFGTGGAQVMAEQSSLKFLDAIPLDPLLCSNSDAGYPAILDNRISEYFAKIITYIISGAIEKDY